MKNQKTRVRVSYSFIKIMTGSDLSRRRLPLMSAVSSEKGPVVWVTACGHGDEVCGIVIIQELFKRISRALLCGSVHAFPLMNPMGFETGSRHITVSREDLNRSFPGRANGSLGERIAAQIMGRIMVTSPSLVLDLHNDWTQSIPYTLIDANPGKAYRESYEKTKQLAKQTGFVTILDTEALSKTLSYNLLLNGVASLTLELGEPYVINEANVGYGLGAIMNLLCGMGMVSLEGDAFRYPLPGSYQARKLLRYWDKPYSSTSGIVRFLVRPGSEVRAGEPFAKVVNAFGKHQETLKAEHDGVVLGHSDSSVVFPGMPIMAFGVV